VNDLHGWITQQVDATEQLLGEGEWPPSQTEGVRLRCEADRRILARHRLDPTEGGSWLYAAACHGCGTFGDCDDPVTDNLNDCPELLDLAHAHGLTDDILASLDRPEPPPPPPPHPDGFYGAFRDGLDRLLGAPTTPIADVPPALRGPNWKADR
jgi:hypothetical protein